MSRRILGAVGMWILAPIACFAAGLYAIGRNLPKSGPVAPKADQSPPPVQEPERADNWLDDSQLPSGMGPNPGERTRRSKPASQETKIGDTPKDTDKITVQPEDQPPTDDSPPPSDSPDIQTPDTPD